MAEEKLSPEEGEVKKKNDETRQSEIENELRRLELDHDPAIVAVMLAVEELKGCKIFPPTPENIRKALINRTRPYLQEADTAEAAVDKYLQVLEKET